MKNKCLTLLMLSLAVMMLSSCVHEWPKQPESRPVGLTVKHELPWELLEFFPDSRSESLTAADLQTRYIYEVYAEGNTDYPVSRTIQYSTDIDLADFVTSLEVPVGTYNIYVWNDFVGTADKNPLFYNAKEFKDVTYLEPYRACSKYKDAFCGKVTVTVPESIDENVFVAGEITLRRPLTAYALVATDFRQFVTSELNRRNIPKVPGATGAYQLPDVEKYKVVVTYTGFLPNEYSVLAGKPVYSKTGVRYESSLTELDDISAMLAFDMFFINGEKSEVSINIDVLDPKGENISSSGNITLPIELSHCTVVRGQFLTQKAGGGVGISPDFDGEINIEIK